MQALLKLVSSFSAGALAGAIGAISTGQTKREAIITAALLAGLAAAGGHALPSAMEPDKSKNSQGDK